MLVSHLARVHGCEPASPRATPCRRALFIFGLPLDARVSKGCRAMILDCDMGGIRVCVAGDLVCPPPWAPRAGERASEEKLGRGRASGGASHSPAVRWEIGAHPCPLSSCETPIHFRSIDHSGGGTKNQLTRKFAVWEQETRQAEEEACA